VIVWQVVKRQPLKRPRMTSASAVHRVVMMASLLDVQHVPSARMRLQLQRKVLLRRHLRLQSGFALRKLTHRLRQLRRQENNHAATSTQKIPERAKGPQQGHFA
jgi:hypothetical protein